MFLKLVPNGIVGGEHGDTFKRHANRLYILEMWQEAPLCLAAIDASESSCINQIAGDNDSAQDSTQDSDDSVPEDPAAKESASGTAKSYEASNRKPKSKPKSKPNGTDRSAPAGTKRTLRGCQYETVAPYEAYQAWSLAKRPDPQ
jgi:hypothetical protein